MNQLTKDKNIICKRCVMDSTDPDIYFDSHGICSHCIEFEEKIKKNWLRGEKGKKELEKIVENIKKETRGKSYNAILGLSGGMDSSYLAILMKDYGLKILALHVDAGWNSEIAVSNIEKILDYTGYDLYTEVIDWEQMRELQLAYLKSGVENLDVPQDHIFNSILYKTASRLGIKYILSGGNIATESILPKAWEWSALDSRNLKSIAKNYKVNLRKYETIGFFEHYIFHKKIIKIKSIRPLNYVDYNKNNAIKVLKKTCGWQSYKYKHGESIFTSFFQNYIQPTKYKIDKRKAHLSSLILSEQLSREEALSELKNLPYDDYIEYEKQYMANKLQISLDELENILLQEPKSFRDYPNWEKRIKLITLVFVKINLIRNFLAKQIYKKNM